MALSDAQLADYVALLRAGGIIACPTETLFGLLADARDDAVVDRIIALKQRGSDPIALIAPDVESALRLAADVPEAARALAERYWPGPLTLVMKARAGLPAGIVRDGTVGVRVPGPSRALELVRAFAGPLTATSCNPSGQPAARSHAEARTYFPTGLAAVVTGASPGGAASTIVDVTQGDVRVLRRGAIPIP